MKKERHNPATKPYFRCLSCAKFRIECGGMPTRGMDLREWCEYLRDVKEKFHLTNADIAEQAAVSIGTVNRIMSLNIEQDIMRSTARQIESVVIGAVGNHICFAEHFNAEEEIEKLKEEAAFWKKENERKSKVIDKLLAN